MIPSERRAMRMVYFALLLLVASLYLNLHVLVGMLHTQAGEPPDEEFMDLETVSAIMQDFADSHNYTTGVYDCNNYSRDLVAELRAYGIYAEMRGGTWSGNESGHAWVKLVLNVEPQNGLVAVNYADKYPYKRFGYYCDKWVAFSGGDNDERA